MSGGRNPASSLAGGEGGEGYEHQEVRSYLGVRSHGIGMAGVGSPAWNRGRRPVWSAVAATALRLS